MIVAEGFFSKLPAPKRRHYQRLLLAVAISLLLHALLLSAPFSVRLTPAQTQPVINAELRQPEVSARTLQDEAPAQVPTALVQAAQTQEVAQSQSETVKQNAAVKQSAAVKHNAVPEQIQKQPQAKTEAAKQQTQKPIPEPQAAPQPRQQSSAQTAQQPSQKQSGLVTEKEDLSADPLERSYQQQLLAHLRERVIAPAQFTGSVRLELTLSYRQVATNVRVIRSSGDPLMDDWAVKAALSANPYPRVPDELPASYTFRPTIRTLQ